MKQLYLVANWKSNKTVSESLEWLHNFKLQVSDFVFHDQIVLILCVPFTVAAILQEELSKIVLPIHMGVQNVSSFSSGAYTGEVSAEMLTGITEYVIIGHSERRRYFNESDEDLFKKTEEAKNHGLLVIYCVENADQPIPESVDLVLYEPQTAIGSGKTEDPTISNEMCKEISIKHHDIPVLYGGSVTEETVQGIVSQENISGVGVGGASLKPDQFMRLIKAFSSYV